MLTAGHNAYSIFPKGLATSLRTTISTNVNTLPYRLIDKNPANSKANATGNDVNFLADYNTTEVPEDDIALITISNTPLAASAVIGIIAFVNPSSAQGLTIETAGYPGDNVSSNIPGNSGVPDLDLVQASGSIVDTKNRRFFYSPTVDTAAGQSGSGLWHTLDGDSTPRVLGVHTLGASADGFLSPNRNSGVLITTDIYDEIVAQMEADSGTANANDLPENAIIGTDPSTFLFFFQRGGEDFIRGSYRRERIIGKGGNDKLFGGGANDRLEGGGGVDQALFSEEFTEYTVTIIDPNQKTFEINHTSGTMAEGIDTTEEIEFAVFEFNDANNDGRDDNGNLFFVPLQIDPNDNTKLKDGPEITPEVDILDNNEEKIGTITVSSPAWMFDGDVEYTLTLGSEQSILFNLAYIIDISGSMDGERLVQAQAAYQALTQALIDNGIADNSEFAVIPFNGDASLRGPVDASTAISIVNGLSAGCSTEFGPALREAQNFFNSRNNNATNIAYFLSDGQGNGASNSLQSVAEVRAFGIGGADLTALNIIDSDDAVALSNPADLVTAFNAATVDRNTIERIDVKLDGKVIEMIAPSQLTENSLGLQYKGTIDMLEVTREAENDIVFDVVFNNGTPTASLNYIITTGQEEVTRQTNNGTREIITFSVNQSDFTPTPSPSLSEFNIAIAATNQLESREIIGNDLDNVITVQDLENTLFGNGGNDRFILLGGINLVDGGEGIDTVQINKTQAEAGAISQPGNIINIGTDTTLLNVEFIEFSDVRLSTDTLTVTPILSLAETAISITEGDSNSNLATFTINLSIASLNDLCKHIVSFQSLRIEKFESQK